VEGVALPVELDAVPVVTPADLFDVVEAALPDFGHGHVPRQGKPLRGAVAEYPLRVLIAQGLDAVSVVQSSQIVDLSTAEVVVVHAHRGVHVEA
jgi:hypothetical protein